MSRAVDSLGVVRNSAAKFTAYHPKINVREGSGLEENWTKRPIREEPQGEGRFPQS